MDSIKEFNEEFINEDLKNKFKICDIKRDVTDLKNINVKMLKELLNKRYVDGSVMKSILCLFDMVFFSLKFAHSPSSNIQFLSKNINKWIRKMSKLTVMSVSGTVFITEMFGEGIDVIIKTSQQLDDKSDILREYYIGITEINKLRYFVPNFVYTFGLFGCPPLKMTGHVKVDLNKICDPKTGDIFTKFIVYEKVNGETFRKLHDKITKEDFLNIFYQLLIALEVAQRKIGFTHFDLHLENVMLIKLKEPFEYSVIIGDSIYKIKATKYLAMIIDYGHSVVRKQVDNKGLRYIGAGEFPEYGMVNYMIPGYDMYKFLYFVAVQYSRRPDQHKIMPIITQIFKEFYGRNDPYKLVDDNLTFNLENLQRVLEEYGKKITYSIAGSFSPLLMANFLERTFNLKFVKINLRDRLQILPTVSSDIYFEQILNKDILPLISKVETCSQKSKSFLTDTYINYIMESYLKNFQGVVSVSLMEKVKHKKEKQLVDKKGFKDFLENQDDYQVIKVLGTELPFILKEKVGAQPQTCNERLNEYEAGLYLNYSFKGIRELENLFAKIYMYYELNSRKLIADSTKPFTTKFEKNDLVEYYVKENKYIYNNMRWREILLYSTFYNLIDNISLDSNQDDVILLLTRFSDFGFYIEDIITYLMKSRSK